jgi:DNA-binding MarR family transcriptional regulator
MANFMDDMPSSDRVAHELIEVIPKVMQRLRAEVRQRREADLSVLQIRVLAFLNRNPGSPLSAVADHVGLTLPSMSSQVSGLVGRNMIHRSVSAEDRRFVTLTLTDQGREVMEAALRGAETSMAQIFTGINADERKLLMDALALLRQLFTSAPPST